MYYRRKIVNLQNKLFKKFINIILEEWFIISDNHEPFDILLNYFLLTDKKISLEEYIGFINSIRRKTSKEETMLIYGMESLIFNIF